MNTGRYINSNISHSSEFGNVIALVTATSGIA